MHWLSNAWFWSNAFDNFLPVQLLHGIVQILDTIGFIEWPVWRAHGGRELDHRPYHSRVFICGDIISARDEVITWKRFSYHMPFFFFFFFGGGGGGGGTVIRSFHFYLCFNLERLLNKQPEYRWFEMPWYLHDVTTMIYSPGMPIITEDDFISLTSGAHFTNRDKPDHVRARAHPTWISNTST